MTVPLQSPYAPPDPMVFALNWYRPLGAADAIAAKRWAAGMKTPYRWISVVNNPRKGFTTYPVIRIHTLAATYTEAAREANRTDNRSQVLVEYPGYVPNLLFCEITEAAHEEPYAAESVATRFVSEIRCAFTLVAV